VSWFHKHDLQLVAKTYSPPSGSKSLKGDPDICAKLIAGVTTLVWKCSDPTCTKIVLVEALGKEEV